MLPLNLSAACHNFSSKPIVAINNTSLITISLNISKNKYLLCKILLIFNLDKELLF